MNDLAITDYLHTKQIDTFQKLWFLLFLHRNPDLKGTSQDFAEWLYLGDRLLSEQILADLHKAGLVDRVDGYLYTLQDEPEVKVGLQHLSVAFEHPIARQKLLDQVRYGSGLSLHQNCLEQSAALEACQELASDSEYRQKAYHRYDDDNYKHKKHKSFLDELFDF